MKLFILLLPIFITGSTAENKYTAEANDKVENLVRPFRMAKVNAVWEKAQKRLVAEKMRKLYSDLKVQDKEEMALKKLKADNLDKDGLKEARVRKAMRVILERYNLADKFDFPTESKPGDKLLNEPSDEKIAKSLFRDKKLRKLWEKALKSGMTSEELEALKEEFQHHEEKIDQYYQLVNTDHQPNQDFNELENDVRKFDKIEELESQKGKHKLKTETAKEKQKELKHSYDRLEKLATHGPGLDEFTEHKVAELWKMAGETNFSPQELESLKTELLHYEHRLLKIRFLKSQQSIHENSNKKLPHEKPYPDEKLERQQKHADKLHKELHAKILQRHIDL